MTQETEQRPGDPHQGTEEQKFLPYSPLTYLTGLTDQVYGVGLNQVIKALPDNAGKGTEPGHIEAAVEATLSALSTRDGTAVILRRSTTERPYSLELISGNGNDPRAQNPETPRLLLLGFDPTKLDQQTLDNPARPSERDLTLFVLALRSLGTVLMAYQNKQVNLQDPFNYVRERGLDVHLLSLPPKPPPPGRRSGPNAGWC